MGQLDLVAFLMCGSQYLASSQMFLHGSRSFLMVVSGEFVQTGKYKEHKNSWTFFSHSGIVCKKAYLCKEDLASSSVVCPNVLLKGLIVEKLSILQKNESVGWQSSSWYKERVVDVLIKSVINKMAVNKFIDMKGNFLRCFVVSAFFLECSI